MTNKEEYKHVGIQISKNLHRKLKTMALQRETTITDLVTPLIKELIEKWEIGVDNHEN